MAQHRPNVAQTVHRLLSCAASDNATVASATPVDLVGLVVSNTAAAAKFLKLYDKATAPTSADTPKLTLRLLPTANAQFSFDVPIEFAVGLSYRITGAIADNDATNPVAADVANLHLLYHAPT